MFQLARIALALGLLGAALATGSACSSSSPATDGAEGPDSGPGGGGDTTALGGRSATTYTCESFPAAELLAAVQTIAPGTTAGHVVTQSLANASGSAMSCSYYFAANLSPGHDPSSLEGQNVDFIVQLRDESIQGLPTPQYVRDNFAKQRDHAKSTASGDSTSDIQALFLPASGLGDDAYFDDYFTRMNGITGNERSELFVLRGSLPMTVSIDMNYGALLPVPAQASDPFQNDMRHPMIAAFAKVVLSKM